MAALCASNTCKNIQTKKGKDKLKSFEKKMVGKYKKCQNVETLNDKKFGWKKLRISMQMFKTNVQNERS